MSTINGYIKDGRKLPVASVAVTFTLVKTPVIDGQALIGSAPVATRTDAAGFFSTVLSMGDWKMVSAGVEVIISVPADDNSYSFNSRVVSAAIFTPTLPPGGADPNASATTLGLVKTNGTQATPVVYLKSEVDAIIAGLSGTYRGTAAVFSGSGSPEGIVTANPGDKYTDLSNPAALREYTKATGTGTNTGWI